MYFYVQKNLDYSSLELPISFESEFLNVGNAMNSTSGVFTAPRSGRYFFTVSGIKEEGPTGVFISLLLNGALTDRTDLYNGVQYTYSLQSTLNMQKGDQVSLMITKGAFHNNSVMNYVISFSGWSLEEDIFS